MSEIRSAEDAVAEWRRRHPSHVAGETLAPRAPRRPEPRPIEFDVAVERRNREVARREAARLRDGEPEGAA